MSERKLTRLYCSKAKSPHELGAARPLAEGIVVEYVEAIAGIDDTVHGVAAEWREGAAIERAEAWCKTCRKRHELDLNEVVRAAREGQRALVLVAEGMTRDPIAVLDRRSHPKR